MNPNLISTRAAAYEIGIYHSKFLHRSKVLKLEGKKLDKSFYWTKEQIEKVEKYKPTKKSKIKGAVKYSPVKIMIIELFLSQNNNSYIEIAKMTNQNISLVNKTIDEFIKTKYIIVESKINL